MSQIALRRVIIQKNRNTIPPRRAIVLSENCFAKIKPPTSAIIVQIIYPNDVPKNT